MTNNKKGFTLIELLVVIAIIGILSAIGLVSLNGAREKARDAQARTDLATMRTALALWYDDRNNTWPATLAVNGTDASYVKGGASGATANGIFDTGAAFSVEYVAKLSSPHATRTYLYKSSAIAANIAVAGNLGKAGAYVVGYNLEGAGGLFFYSVDSANIVKDVVDAKLSMTNCTTDSGASALDGTCTQ